MKQTYSEEFPEIFNEEGRLIIAKQILGIVESQYKVTKNLQVLDLGCSGGEITNYLHTHVKKIIGVDVDSVAITRAKKRYKDRNLKFLKYSGDLPFLANTFDLVICNQVYEVVEDQKKLASQIYKVLKRGGICILGARNKWTVIEGQSGIPFLHIFPTNVASMLARMFGRHYYPAKYLSLYELLALFGKFEVENLTIKILQNPLKYKFQKLQRYSAFLNMIPKPFLSLLIGFIPNYIFICRK